MRKSLRMAIQILWRRSLVKVSTDEVFQSLLNEMGHICWAQLMSVYLHARTELEDGCKV
jgi:hypothetical protein